MSTLERLFHSVLFEVLAVTLSIIGLAIFTDHDVNALSGTMIVVATIAMMWNYCFNRILIATSRVKNQAFAEIAYFSRGVVRSWSVDSDYPCDGLPA